MILNKIKTIVKSVLGIKEKEVATISKKASNFRANINKLETDMKAMEQQVGLVETHHFSNGVYARELFIPEGTLLTGKIHKHENLNILSQGTISVATEDGVKTITAPATIVSKPGTKRLGFAHTDCVWTCVHSTDKVDLEEIENEVISENYDDVDMISESDVKKIKGAI